MAWTKSDIDKLIASGKVRGISGQSEKKMKFRNKKTFGQDGFEFDSKKESVRYLDLKEMQRAGTITDLRRQEKFDLVVNGELVCSYDADFTYMRDGKKVVEDVKSAITRKLPVYRIKKKLMKAVLGIEIVEI